MPIYQALYYLLFHRISLSIEQIERANYGLAKELLIQAQQDAEELYISEEDSVSSPSC